MADPHTEPLPLPTTHRERGAFGPHAALVRKMPPLDKIALPVTTVAAIIVAVGGWIWQASDANARFRAVEAAQATLIEDIRRAAEKQAAADHIRDMAIADRRIREAEILARLAAIEAGVAEIKTLIRSRP